MTQRASASPVGITSVDDGPTKFGVRPPSRRAQLPQLVVALLVVVLGALGSVVLFSQAAARDPILALANPLERGELVAAEDLRVVYVGTDDSILALPPDGLASLVGLAAVADLEAGTIITQDHFTSGAAVGEGEGVVGLALSPGDYPSLQLTPGDLVDVVDVESPEGVVLASAAQVFDVAELGTQGQRFVSLVMPSDTAVEVARIPSGRLRLVLVTGTDS